MKTRFAVPTAGGKLSSHFGHCEQFAIIDTKDTLITSLTFVDPPEHNPGSYPRFLASMDCQIILAGGMGGKAKDLFESENIKVILGIAEDDPKKLVEHYLGNTLESGDNSCDH